MAFAVKNILEPMALLAGGFTGIGIIAKEKLEVPLWVSNVVLNIPVFLVAFICLGRKFVINSLVVTAAFSIAVGILPQWNIVYGDIFLSTVLGGILMGVGLGLVLLTGASSGGVDMISVLVNRYKKNLSVGFVMFSIDAVIIFAGGVIFGWHKAIYSVLTVWIVSTVSEKIMNGPNNAKACIIVSAQNECISGRIIKEVQRGITGLYGRGMYMKRDELVLLCVVSVREVSAIRKIVYEEDKKAFMTTSNVSEVIGEGFIDW
jgi:uncharacterized membrane-anchored protein YitT (DUF2179 family)